MSMVLLVLGQVAIFASCKPEGRRTGGCQVDTDCKDAGKPYCNASVGECVECFTQDQCDCHQICDQNVCSYLGASDVAQKNNAHGLWQGTPGQANYTNIGRCDDSAACGFGEVCNPFTGNCVVAADYQDTCGPNKDCPNGQTCDSTTQKCFPAALCKTDHNCCGYEDFSCDTGANLCVELKFDCTPPSSPSSTCPLEPRIEDECSPGLYCSMQGTCVQCTCDSDCNPESGLPVCDADTGRCVSENFCDEASDCNQPTESCDTVASVCKAYCADDNDCAATEMCTEDNVCKALAEIPCEEDAYEDNDTLETAYSLEAPELNSSQTLSDLTLCEGSSEDDEDWFSMTLENGDKITVTPNNLSGVSAYIKAYGSDGETEIASAYVGSYSTDNLEFTANYDGIYYIRVDLSYNEGFYELAIARTQGEACEDSAEDESTNNTVATVTALNPSSGTTSACTLTGTIGDAHSLECDYTLCVGDVDYYSIEVHNGATLLVEMLESTFTGDLKLNLYGPYFAGEDLSTELSSDSSDTTGDEEVTDSPRPGATYVLKVSRYSGSATDYTLNISVTNGPTCSEDTWDGEAAGAAAGAVLSDAAGLNDLFSGATEVALDASTSVGSLSLCSGDKDWYKLGLDSSGTLAAFAADKRIVAELTNVDPAGADITLALGKAEDNMAYGSQSTASPVRKAVVPLTEAVNYYAYVEADSDEAVSYELSLALEEPPACSADSSDTAASNGTPATATALAPALNASTAVADQNLCLGDDDWYKVSLPDGSTSATVIATVTFDASEDAVGIVLFDATVATETELTQGTPPTTGHIYTSNFAHSGNQTVSGVVSGDAYIMVYNASGWPVLDYDLEVSVNPASCGGDDYDPDNFDCDNAAALTLNPSTYDSQVYVTYMDKLMACEDEDAEDDWYSVALSPGDQLSAYVYRDNNVPGNLDFYLRGLKDDTCPTSSIDYDWDSSYSTKEYLEVTYDVPTDGQGGDYFLEIQPWYTGWSSNENGKYYSLEVAVRKACVDDAYEPATEAAPYALSYSAGSEISQQSHAMCHKSDFFTISVDAAASATVCLAFTHSAGDIDLSVTDSAGAGSVSLGTSDTEKVVVTNSDGDAKTYTIKAFAKSGTVNSSYTLSVLDGSVACP
ncbi:MAG: hypothetical protein CMH60_07040 [Myxococcales bacterium]|nr:hypothetical protein [Myxococcales bacterium]